LKGKAAAAAAAAVKRLVNKGTQVQLSNQAAICASSATKVLEEVEQGQGMLSAPVTVSQQSFNRPQILWEVR
jgi:hypothetical protein